MKTVLEDGYIYYVDDNDKMLAWINYKEEADGVYDIIHTIVDESARGKGVAGRLTEELAEKFRNEHKKTRLTCSYAVAWFAKHPEYSDVLA